MIKFDAPLAWPLIKPRSKRHESGAFQVTPGKAIDSLHVELGKFGGSAVITADWDLGSRDNWPLAKQRSGRDPGVSVLITRRNQTYALACDRYNEHWKNCRALMLCIEALRALERHGDVGLLEQALSGFTALPENAGPSSGDAWWIILGVEPSTPLEVIKDQYRQRIALAHPDKGGSAEEAARINNAWEQAQKAKGGKS